jgi:ABC-type Fe3+-hydroxamate transport system substrate-binding protein
LAWGITPVGCTRFCEQPDLHHVGGTKDPDLAAIRALSPDLVVVDREENRREDAEALTAAGLALHVTHVVHLDDVAPMLRALWVAVGRPGPEPWNGELPAFPPDARRRAFVPIWRRPWMTINADTYGSTVLRACGVDNAFGDSADRYPEVSLDEVRKQGCDLVVLPSEPYAFAERHVPELREGLTGAGAPPIPVVLVDGRDLFWWGVRTPDALTRLSAVLAPQ